LLSKASHKHRYIPPKSRLKVFNSGLLFLSKYPITKCAFERYTHAASIDSLVSKGVGLCNIAISDWDGKTVGTLQVFGTHMQSERTKAAQAARREQALQAASFVLENRTEKGTPAVLVGDMNMGPRQEGCFSQHYSDKDDAQARCSSYHSMVSACGFEEVECEDITYCNEICRFLAQGVDSCNVQYVPMSTTAGERLSDTDALCLSLDVNSL
jgi:endonuclease/exonuclease/phosphatase family metal-dependent hydrolase